MFELKKYQNKKIAVYGMGATGYSVFNVLKKAKANVICWDDSEKVRKKIKGANFKLQKFWLKRQPMDQIVVSPGIDIGTCKIKNYLKKNFNKIITDLDIFFDFNKNSTIISITGTNGKSTTCKIIEKILKTAKYKVQTVGNIGKPILSSYKIKEKAIYILEVSSYQLQYSRLIRSKHAAILNISPDHLDRHKNINNYIKIKSKIFCAQNNSDYSYINSTNKYSSLVIDIFRNKKIKSKLSLVNNKNCEFILKKINNKYLKSSGNVENLAFAYNITKNLKIDDQTIIKALNNFKGLPHRQEIVFSSKKVLCINDSKATSFDACLQSLLNYDKIFWIVGGLPKNQDRFYLKNVKKKIIKAYIIGKNIAFFKRQLKNKIPYTISKNMKNAMNAIYKDCKFEENSRNTILLSPASASFDQFNDFVSRGNYFKNLVLKKFKRS